jgi:hypothetical protein
MQYSQTFCESFFVPKALFCYVTDFCSVSHILHNEEKRELPYNKTITGVPQSLEKREYFIFFIFISVGSTTHYSVTVR